MLALNGFTTSRGVDALLAVYGLLVVASALLMFVIGPAVARRIRGSAAGLGAASSIMSMGCSAGIGAALIVVATIVLIAVFGALR